jgi:glycosyl transferase family 2
MIAFGTAITRDDLYSSIAAPGIARAVEPDSLVMTRRGMSLQRAYNEMLEEASGQRGLEAVVLVHQDTEIADERVAEKVRNRLTDPEVAIIGAIGTSGIDALAWAQNAETFGAARLEIFGVERTLVGTHPEGGADVASVDGFLLVIAGWAARELRFDEEFAPDFHGYDADICYEARARGWRVAVEPIDAVHRPHLGFLRDREAWIRASMRWQRKWGPRPPASLVGN